MKDSQFPKGNSNHRAKVKPGASNLRVDSASSVPRIEIPVFENNLMEDVCAESNVELALRQVERNKGSAGVDGMQTSELRDYLSKNWHILKSTLLCGGYRPEPLKRIEIPKPGSTKKRKLSIPTCLDRLIQQMLLQKLQPRWDRCFSESSFGFRPGKSCADAIKHAQEHIKLGHEFCVDIDLDSFFDRINHDRLMSKLMLQIKDERVISLIRRFLSCKISIDGKLIPQTSGAAQGGPLSPFLSNIVLDDLDRELEERGLNFTRYADDLQIFVSSSRAGERVFVSISKFIESKLKLKVNKSKSAVDKPQNRKFLGFSFTSGKLPNRIKVHPDSIKKFKFKVKKLTRRNSGKSLDRVIGELNPFLRGWNNYFSTSETRYHLGNLDSWIRRRLRSYQWKAWKTYQNRKDKLYELGVPYDLACRTAFSCKSYWRISTSPGVQMALTSKFFDSIGLYRLTSKH